MKWVQGHSFFRFLRSGQEHPRFSIGSVNLAEGLVALSTTLTFVAIIGLPYWQAILGLAVGGAIAAPVGASVATSMPAGSRMVGVCITIILISLRTIYIG